MNKLKCKEHIESLLVKYPYLNLPIHKNVFWPNIVVLKSWVYNDPLYLTIMSYENGVIALTLLNGHCGPKNAFWITNCSLGPFHDKILGITHLSKGTNDLKQNWMQEQTVAAHISGTTRFIRGEGLCRIAPLYTYKFLLVDGSLF